MFVAVRKYTALTFVLIFGCAVCYLVTPVFVNKFEMYGIAYAIIVSQSVITAVFSVLLILMIRKMQTKSLPEVK